MIVFLTHKINPKSFLSNFWGSLHSRQHFNTNPQKHDTMAQKRRGPFLLGINPFFIKFILLIGIVMAAQWACDGYKPKKKEEPVKKEAEPYKKYNYLVNSYEPTAKSDYCWVYNYKSSRATAKLKRKSTLHQIFLPIAS